MVTRTTAAAIAVAGLALGAAACGPSHSKAAAKSKVSALATSSAGTDARTIVNQCFSKITNSPVHPLKKFAKCVAGPGAPKATIAKIESCGEKAALADSVLTSKSGRAKWEATDLPNCVVSSR